MLYDVKTYIMIHEKILESVTLTCWINY